MIHIIFSSGPPVSSEKLYFPACTYFLAFRMGTIIKRRLRKSAMRIHVSPAQRRQYFPTRHSESNCAGRIPYLSSKSKNTIVMGSSIPGFNAADTAAFPVMNAISPSTSSPRKGILRLTTISSRMSPVRINRIPHTTALARARDIPVAYIIGSAFVLGNGRCNCGRPISSLISRWGAI